MTSTRTSGSMSGTVTTCSSAMATVFRTYFVNGRGDEAMGTVWSYLDITPLGRQETWENSPEGYPQSAPYKWWNWHDNYDAEPSHDSQWAKVSDAGIVAIRKRSEEEKAS